MAGEQKPTHDPSTGFHDIKPSPDFAPPAPVPLPLLALIAVALLGALIFRRLVSSRNFRPATALVPPLAQIESNLDRLEAELAEGKISLREFGSRLSVSFRSYLEAQLDRPGAPFPASDCTVPEVLTRLPATLRKAGPLAAREIGAPVDIAGIVAPIGKILQRAEKLTFADERSLGGGLTEQMSPQQLLSESRKIALAIENLGTTAGSLSAFSQSSRISRQQRRIKMELRFDTPEALLLLVFVPLVWRLASCPTPAWRKLVGHTFSTEIASQSKSLERVGIAYSPGVDLATLPLSASQSGGNFIANLLRCAAMILLILALARPQTASRFVETEASGRDLMLTLDLSGSMEAMDFFIGGRRVTRLTALKAVVQQFIEQRRGDRMGLVVFGEQVFTQCPLTLDHDALKKYVDSMEVSMAGSATAIGDAIAISLKRIKDIEADSKVIVLVTDGKDNFSRISPVEAAEAAKTLGIKIHVIGIGGPGTAPFPVQGVFGTTLIERDVDYDEKALTRIAATTGGEYFNAKNTEGLIKIYQEIDQLEKRTEKTQEFVEHDERFLLALIPAVLFLLIERALAATVQLRVP